MVNINHGPWNMAYAPLHAPFIPRPPLTPHSPFHPSPPFAPRTPFSSSPAFHAPPREWRGKTIAKPSNRLQNSISGCRNLRNQCETSAKHCGILCDDAQLCETNAKRLRNTTKRCETMQSDAKRIPNTAKGCETNPNLRNDAKHYKTNENIQNPSMRIQ